MGNITDISAGKMVAERPAHIPSCFVEFTFNFEKVTIYHFPPIMG